MKKAVYCTQPERNDLPPRADESQVVTRRYQSRDEAYVHSARIYQIAKDQDLLLDRATILRVIASSKILALQSQLHVCLD